MIFLPFLMLWLAACVPATPPSHLIAATAHPLDDRIWSVKDDRFLDRDALLREMTSARYLLLGELHDNPRHHALQAWVVRAMTEKNRRLALVVEMIAADQANALKLFYETPRDTSDLLRLFLDWDKSGWPEWAMYAPIFNAALRGEYVLHPGNLDRTVLPAMHKTGWAALDDETRNTLKLPDALPELIGPALKAIINESHCGALPDRVLGPFAEIQFARDASLAHALVTGRGADGAILIAGAEHVRTDRGVPWHLRRIAAEGRILSVAFVETRAGQMTAADYDLGAYDIVWFTPALERASPCPAR